MSNTQLPLPGIARREDREPALGRFVTEAIEREIRQFAATGMRFTAENIRAELPALFQQAVDTPRGRAAFGMFFREAARRREIMCVEYVEAERDAAKGRILRVWRGVPK
jgi:hypothetical protein